MTLKCVYCDIRRDYYATDEHASRQNCLCSDSGYHHFEFYSWCWPFRRKSSKRNQLLTHRRGRRPNTI